MSGSGPSTAQPERPALTGRAAARLAAVQALYQIASTGEDPAAVIEDFLRHRLTGSGRDPEEPDSEGLDLDKVDAEFFRDLVAGVAKESEDLDDMLSAVLAEDWPVERLARLLKLILSAGAFELGHWPSVPARVAVSQYVDLAHAFLDDRQTAMANGVLDQLARHLRPEEFAGEALPDLSA